MYIHTYTTQTNFHSTVLIFKALKTIRSTIHYITQHREDIWRNLRPTAVPRLFASKTDINNLDSRLSVPGKVGSEIRPFWHSFYSFFMYTHTHIQYLQCVRIGSDSRACAIFRLDKGSYIPLRVYLKENQVTHDGKNRIEENQIFAAARVAVAWRACFLLSKYITQISNENIFTTTKKHTHTCAWKTHSEMTCLLRDTAAQWQAHAKIVLFSFFANWERYVELRDFFQPHPRSPPLTHTHKSTKVQRIV